MALQFSRFLAALGVAMAPVDAWADLQSYRPPLTVAIVNTSTVVSDADVALWSAAVQRQVHEELAPVWKVDAEIVFRNAPQPGDWVCVIDDGPTDDKAPLGVHFVDENGAPACAVHAMAVLRQNGALSVNLSHEVLEMLVDPWLSNVTFAPSAIPNGATVYLREVCDPVASASYEIDGVRVADFTWPQFWRYGVPVTSKLDQLGFASIPLQPAAHSYLLVRQIAPFGGIDSITAWRYLWGSYCIFGPC